MNAGQAHRYEEVNRLGEERRTADVDKTKQKHHRDCSLQIDTLEAFDIASLVFLAVGVFFFDGLDEMVVPFLAIGFIWIKPAEQLLCRFLSLFDDAVNRGSIFSISGDR